MSTFYVIKPFMLLVYLVFHQQNLLTYTDGSANENTSRFTGHAVGWFGPWAEPILGRNIRHPVSSLVNAPRNLFVV